MSAMLWGNLQGLRHDAKAARRVQYREGLCAASGCASLINLMTAPALTPQEHIYRPSCHSGSNLQGWTALQGFAITSRLAGYSKS